MRPSLFTPTLAALIAGAGIMGLPARAASVAPLPTLQYDGLLLGMPSGDQNGPQSFTFKILNSSQTVLWSSGSLVLTVYSGQFSVVLGGAGMPALPAGLSAQTGLTLAVTVNGQATPVNLPILPAGLNLLPYAGSVAGMPALPSGLGSMTGLTLKVTVNGQAVPVNAPIGPWLLGLPPI